MRAEIERALSGRPSLSSVERDSANRLLESSSGKVDRHI